MGVETKCFQAHPEEIFGGGGEKKSHPNILERRIAT